MDIRALSDVTTLRSHFGSSHFGSSRDRLPGSRLGFLVSVGSARVQGVHSLLHRRFVKS